MRYLLPLGVFIVVAGFLFYGLNLNPREVPSPLVGKPAPAFQLARLDAPASCSLRDAWLPAGFWGGRCLLSHHVSIAHCDFSCARAVLALFRPHPCRSERASTVTPKNTAAAWKSDSATFPDCPH